MNIYIYSRGEFLNLDSAFLQGKAIISIKNSDDAFDYSIKSKNLCSSSPKMLQAIFDDVEIDYAPRLDKLEYMYPSLSFLIKNFKEKNKRSVCYFANHHAGQIIDYIKAHKLSDFIIHCEYGKSRSVTVGKFIADYFRIDTGYRSNRELAVKNRLVYRVLKEQLVK